MVFLRRNIEGGIVYEIDFTALDSVSDLGEGAITIDGVTWYSWNNGGANKTQIVNGSGIRLYGNGSAGSNQTSSILGMDIGQLFGGVTYSTGFEVWVDVANSGGPISGWGTFAVRAIGIDNIPSTDSNNINMCPVLPYFGWNQSANGLRYYEGLTTNGGTIITSNSSTLAQTSPSTWVLRGAGTGFQAYYGTPATAPDWPDKSSLTLLGSRTTGVTRTYPNTLFGPRFWGSIDNTVYLEIRRMRILRVWSGD